MAEVAATFSSFFTENRLAKPGYVPECTVGDTPSPRISKIGGAIPHLPGEAQPACQCGNNHELLLQLYIPLLPKPVQALFPQSHANDLIIFPYCTECMESNFLSEFRIYTSDQLDSLVFSPVAADAKIEARTINSWQEFSSFDCTSEVSYAAVRNAGLDEIAMEEFGRDMKHKYGTYLLGYPHHEQGEYDVGDGFVYLASFAQDRNFSMMWGVAGVAHLWMKSGEAAVESFNLTWMCG